MFRMTRLRFHNICQYEDIDIPLELGLMAVCGRNGSGKTTLLRGLVYALTGLVDGSWGNQTDLQKDGTADPGWVELTLTDHTRSIVIRRFSTSGVKFADTVTEHTSEGTTVVAQRRRTVDSYLSGIYGIPCDLLFQICWGRQGQMDTLLTAPAAFINSFLSSVFDTKYLETIRSKLKIQIDTVAQLSASCLDAIATSESILKDFSVDFIKSKEADVMRLDGEIDEQLKRVAELEVQIRNAPEAAHWTLQMNQYKRSLQAAQEERQSLLENVVNKPGENVPECFSKTLKNELHEIDLRFAKFNSDYKITEGQYKQALDRIADRQAHLTKIEDAYKAKIDQLLEPSTICHLCKGTIVDSEAYELNKVKMLTGCNSRSEFEQAHLTDVKQLNQAIATDQAQAERLNAELTGIAQHVDKLIKYQKEIQEAFEYATAFEDWEHYQTRLSESESNIKFYEDCIKQLNTYPPATEELSCAFKDQQAILQSFKTTRENLISEINELKASRSMHEMALEENRKLAAQYEINKEARNILVKLRDVFSQHRAQARYLKSKIAELNQKISDFLTLTDMPFTLALNDDTHVFEYVTAEGFTHPAAHLSGAQKNISAVVLQMAIFEVVQPNINLFLVDEPSESLDEENKIIMADLFQRMNRMLPTIEGTMMIVSRDTQLIESCENVLNVSEV